MMLLFLIMRCMPTRELIVATPLPLSSQPATGLSALAPAQRAGAQRLCAMAHLEPLVRSAFAPQSTADLIRRNQSIAARDPKRTW